MNSVMDRRDGIKWYPRITVEKWTESRVEEMRNFLGREPMAEDFYRHGVIPAEVVHDEGNILVTSGLGLLTSLLTGAGGSAMSTTQTGVGVGSTSTAAAVANTALGADTTSGAWYQLCDASPGVTRQTVTVTNDSVRAVATFASGNANFAWNEWCLVTGSGTFTSGNTLASLSTGTETMLNRKAPVTLGTKASGTVWALTVTITFS